MVGEAFLPLMPCGGVERPVIVSIEVDRDSGEVRIGVKTEPGRTYALLRSPTISPRSDYEPIGVEAVAVSNRLVLADRDANRPTDKAFYIVTAR